jgi:hypothetical protein
MAKIRATIEFENPDGTKHKYEKEISAPNRKLEKSMENVAQRTFSDLEKDLFFCKAFDALLDPYGLYKQGKHLSHRNGLLR